MDTKQGATPRVDECEEMNRHRWGHESATESIYQLARTLERENAKLREALIEAEPFVSSFADGKSGMAALAKVRAALSSGRRGE